MEELMMSMDMCDGDYLGSYRRFLEHFVANVCDHEDQLPVKMGRRDVRDCELTGEIADISLQHLNQRICPPSLQAYLVKLVINEFKLLFQKSPDECGYRSQDKAFSPLKLMQTVTSKVNEICQRYLDNSRLALLPPPPSIPLPLTSSYAIKNRRRKMEDRSVVLHDLHTMFSIENDSVVNYYAVFDGHAGQEAATYCAAHLHQYLVESSYYPLEPEFALRDAFHTTDKRFSEGDDTKNSGATAVCALLFDKSLYIAWAGDSQAALIKSGRGINLTIPHKPERPDEKQRIKDLGGEIVYFGTWRVNGVINVSRSIGDSKYKPWVTEEPDVIKMELDGTEDFLIVACDGFWERATEDIVASLLYEYVGSGMSDSNSASEALVGWAKQNLSEDNISVIVVFLTSPAEIAAKGYFVATSNSRKPVSMDQSGGMEHESQQPFVDYGFAKTPIQVQPNGAAEDFNGSLLESANGLHRPKPPKYNDEDEDDEEDEEGDEDDDDLGPETNVDVVDDAQEFEKLDQAVAQNYPDEFMIKMPTKADDVAKFPLQFKGDKQNDADNIGESEDSDDEWNYYRPNEGSNKSSNEEQRIDSAGCFGAKDPSLVKKPDCNREEKESCSPKEDEDNSCSSSDQSPLHQPSLNQVSNELYDEHAASFEVEKESKETHQDVDFVAESNVAYDTATHERQYDYDEDRILSEELPINESKPEALTEELLNFEKLEESRFEPNLLQEETTQASNKESCLSQNQLLPEQALNENNIEAEAAINNSNLDTDQVSLVFEEDLIQELQETIESTYKINCKEENKENDITSEKDSEDDMESHLNPDAAEFVPHTGTSPISPLTPQMINQMNSDLIAGSPLKQSQRALKNTKIPSEEEFYMEVCSRPSDVNDSVTSDISNGDILSSPMKNTFDGFCEDNENNENKRKNLFTNLMDEYEVSSTKAEFGDESTANLSAVGEFCKTEVSNVDVSNLSFTDRDDVMSTSMTPSDFKNAFDQSPDLNKVHDLSNDDDMIEVHNGLTTVQETEEKMATDDEDNGILNQSVDLDLENLEPHQEQSVELFTAVVEQRKSQTSDMFSTSRGDFKNYDSKKTETTNCTDNNPFSYNFVTNNESSMNNLGQYLEAVKLEEVIQDNNHEDEQIPEKVVDDPSPSVQPKQIFFNEESQFMNDAHQDVMINPLNLNLGVTIAVDQKMDEPLLVSPVKESQIMSSEFHEEDLMTKSSIECISSSIRDFQPEGKAFVANEKQPTDTLIAIDHENMVANIKNQVIDHGKENLGVEFVKENNELSSAYLETNIERETHQETPTLKENLAEEPKDVEEISTPSSEAKSDGEPLITNEAPITGTASSFITTADAVTAMTTSAAVVATKTSKPSTVRGALKSITGKPGVKSTTPGSSPAKTSIAAKTSTSTSTKKTAATASRPKTATTGATKPPSAASKYTLLSRPATTTSRTTSTAAKTVPRTTAAIAATSRAKLLSSVTSKVGSTISVDKKPLTNGDIKAPSKPIIASRVTTKSATNTITTKVGLVKTSTTTTTRTSGGASTNSATLKVRPTSATSSNTTVVKSRLSGNFSSLLNNATARPRTAPVSGATKLKTAPGSKSPMIDKHNKETVNKQISSARNIVSASVNTRTRVPSTTSANTTVKRQSLAPSKAPLTSVSPSKKAPVQVSKPGPVKLNNVHSKINSRATTTVTKGGNNVTTTNTTATTQQKIVQNGVSVPKTETNTTTNTMSTNIEEDIPKKDVSPIEPVTDNQLITAE